MTTNVSRTNIIDNCINILQCGPDHNIVYISWSYYHNYLIKDEIGRRTTYNYRASG